MYDKSLELINNHNKIIIIQAENPDGDSLASSLALEYLLSDLGKEVVMYCPVEIPRYLHYIEGWDRVVNDFDTKADMAIIVDTSADVLISKVLGAPGVRRYLDSHDVLVIDHHTASTPDLSFDYTLLLEEAVSASEVIYRLAVASKWDISREAATHILEALLSDTLGLNTKGVTSQAYKVAGDLVELGAHPSEIEDRRREYMKKSPEILEYKGKLIGRIEYYLDGKLALIRIPFEEIQKYSDQYNPSILVLDELRLVEGVEVAVATKTYPDGKLTGKIRSSPPVSADIAGYFGGGGHSYAAGFRVYEGEEKIVEELIDTTHKVLSDQVQS